MATLGELPPEANPIVLGSGNTVLEVALAKNCVIVPTNDTFLKKKSRKKLPFFVQKIEGQTKWADLRDLDSSARGVFKGVALYQNHARNGDNSFHFLAAFGNKIYAVVNGEFELLRDVSDDNREIKIFSVQREKKYAFISIGDERMSSEMYKYDGTKLQRTLEMPKPMTAMDAPYFVGKMQDRLVISTYDDPTKVLYSKLDSTGAYSDFTTDIKITGGGQLAGIDGGVTGFLWHKGVTAVCQRDRISFHALKAPIYGGDGAGLQKDVDTLKQGYTIDHKGITQPDAICAGRDKIFFNDGRSGVYQYDLITQSLVELTKNFQQEFLRYDWSRSSVCYDPKRDCLYVTGSSRESLSSDTILIYNFKSKGWSVDTEKRVSKLFYNRADGEIYGVSSLDPVIYQVFDGTYSNDGEPIQMEVTTRFHDAGRPSRAKEYIDSSFTLGFEQGVEKFELEFLLNKRSPVQLSETIMVADKRFEPELISPQGGFGDEIVSGGHSVNNSQVAFYQHFNEDPLTEDFSSIAIRVREKSNNLSMMGNFEIVCRPTDDEIAET